MPCPDVGHQIIVTTHDMQQADFIAAKFRADSLPAELVLFERRFTPQLGLDAG